MNKKFACAAFATLVIAAGTMLIPFADATARSCRGDKEGKARVPGVGPEAARAATHAAIADWKREVLEDCGVYARWSTALDREIRCKEKRDDVTKCKVEATPAL
jgi:hypothetical protein